MVRFFEFLLVFKVACFVVVGGSYFRTEFEGS